MEKMAVKDQATTRANVYGLVTEILEQNGMPTQPIKGGRLIDLGNGYFGKISVSVCDPSKVDEYVQAYAEQMQVNAERAQARAEKEAEKARKAEERATKRASKDPEEE